MSDAGIARMLVDAPLPWTAEQGADGLHALVDSNGKLVARSPMFGWLEAIATLVQRAEGSQARSDA